MATSLCFASLQIAVGFGDAAAAAAAANDFCNVYDDGIGETS